VGYIRLGYDVNKGKKSGIKQFDCTAPTCASTVHSLVEN